MLDYMGFISRLPFGIVVLFLIWTLFWKGLALWRSAKDNQKRWFIAILIVNSVGILELTYLFFFAKKKFSVDSLFNK